MYGSFDCPDCGRELKSKSFKCQCGWKKKDSPKGALACNHSVYRFPCGQKALFSFEQQDGGYLAFCEQHYDEVRPKGELEIKMLEKTKEISQQARVAGMTNREYAEAVGFVKIFEDIRKGEEKRERRCDE